MRYVYSVIRFVPDPGRGEFINIGAIAGTDAIRDWDIRNVDNLRRARSIDDRGVLRGVISQMDQVARTIDAFVSVDGMLFPPPDAPVVNEDWLLQMSQESRNLLQFSPPIPVLANSAQEALDLIFDELLLDPERRRFRFKKKQTALGAVAQAYTREGLDRFVHQRAHIKGGRHSELLDFVVANGRVVQLTQCYSFQIPNSVDLLESIKALAWTLHAIREGGGLAVVGDVERPIPQDVDVEIVYVQPENQDRQQTDVLNEARSAFEKVDARAVPYEQANEVVGKAHELLAHQA